MPAYLQIEGIEGDVTQADHKKWIAVKSVSHPITRTIRSGAKGMERSQGSTTIGDLHIVRLVDRSSPKLAEACAGGKFFKTATIDLCNVINGKVVKFHTHKLSNVILTSYSFHGTEDSEPPATEELTMNFTKVNWVYTVNDKDTGEKKSEMPAEYSQDQE
jgi:type VI secretion system secreted protein Hcp